ncbi:MAG: hypothetical protein J6Z49_00040 [Kiritimatiellae bacterium]|nr:hypothetical protein [Kiritimatiellia bacterium]
MRSTSGGSVGKAADGAAAKEVAKDAAKRAGRIKHSKYALGKTPENLTDRQWERLSVIQAEDRPNKPRPRHARIIRGSSSRGPTWTRRRS